MGKTRLRFAFPALALVWAGCDPPPEPRVERPALHFLALGAEVVAELSTSECNRPFVQCIERAAVSLDDVKVDHDTITRVVASEITNGVVRVTLRGEAPGQSILQIRYVDAKQTEHVEEMHVRVVEATPVVEFSCDEGRTQTSSPVAIRAGETFELLTGFTSEGTSRLATGDLAPVEDYAPFSVVNSDGRTTTLTAPTSTGEHVWRLHDGSTLVLNVFDALSAEPLAQHTEGSPQLSISPGVNGSQACVLGPALDATVSASVVEGPCVIDVGGLITEGHVPVFAPSGKATYSVTSTTPGMASCAIEVRYASGTSSVATVTGVTGESWGGGWASAGPQESASLYTTSCSTSSWDDDCDPRHPDLDCISLDATWSLDVPGAAQEGKSWRFGELGVGLETAFGLAILGPLDARYPPADLAIQGGTDVASQTLECSADTDYLGVKLTPRQPGEHVLSFSAANIEDSLTLSFAASVVERSSLLASADGAVVDVFEYSILDLQPTYYASDGSKLSGHAPIDVTTTVPGTVSGRDPRVSTGPAPAEIQIATTVAPSRVVLNVVGVDWISELSGLDDATIPVEETYCIPLSARGPSGAAILGTPPARPSVRIVGDALSLSQATDLQVACVYARSPGTGVLELTWGSAHTSVTFTAEAP